MTRGVGEKVRKKAGDVVDFTQPAGDFSEALVFAAAGQQQHQQADPHQPSSNRKTQCKETDAEKQNIPGADVEHRVEQLALPDGTPCRKPHADDDLEGAERQRKGQHFHRIGQGFEPNRGNGKRSARNC